MAGKNSLDQIKQDLEPFVGTQVKLRANQGRKRVMEAEGVLEKVYPKVFVVKLNDRPGIVKRVSYAYVDLLTESVELTVCQEDREKRIGCIGL